jgi:hypothetical protein
MNEDTLNVRSECDTTGSPGTLAGNCSGELVLEKERMENGQREEKGTGMYR